MTAPVPPPPAPPTTNAAHWWRKSRSWAEQNLGRNGTIAASIAAFFLVTTIVATALLVSNYNAAISWEAGAREARAERDAVRDELAATESRADTLEAASDTMQDTISTLESEAGAVAQKAADLEAQAAALAEREAAVTATEQQIAANTIREGVWTVGVDIEPGTYRTKESPNDCYWAIYTSGTNQDDIIQNDIVTGGMPTVTLREGQDFETNRCGEWAKQ